MALRQRLLQDIAELQANPYPNIELCMQDDHLQQACLLLNPSGKPPLHLTIVFGKQYPLKAPHVTIQTMIHHPNVFNSGYICASILNTEDGYTPAYTLKGIAIQLLSFFSSDYITQEGGRLNIDLKSWDRNMREVYGERVNSYCCVKCGFGRIKPLGGGSVASEKDMLANPFAKQRKLDPGDDTNSPGSVPAKGAMEIEKTNQPRLIDRILTLPDEISLLIFAELETKDLLAAAKVCQKIGDLVTSYDFIRMRELQCFCLKETFLEAKLGVGVNISGRGKQGMLGSEFDLLSQQAFDKFHVRRSIQGLLFEHWLPLPISRRHWRSVRADVDASLTKLAQGANIPTSEANVGVLYSFMSDIVVKLSNEAKETWGDRPKSTLTYASEKAVESYFGLFHLLLCIATENDQSVRDANRNLLRFLGGATSKDAFPSLGHLLVTVLITKQGLTDELTLAIIKEAILRNVVWMLDTKGAGVAELSYLEPSAISDYRLQKTFEASKTSYRLLMFLALFYRTARPPGVPLNTLCDEMFDKHGAPPSGTAERLAKNIRHIRTVGNFPEFFKAMGLKDMPSKENLCTFLKKTIEKSVMLGYSRWALTQGQALAIRRVREPSVEVAEGVGVSVKDEEVLTRREIGFFPGKKKGGGGRG